MLLVGINYVQNGIVSCFARPDSEVSSMKCVDDALTSIVQNAD